MTSEIDDSELGDDVADDLSRDPVEVLISEFIERTRDQDAPTIDEFIAEHPEVESELRELLPMIAAVENLKDPDLSSTMTMKVPERLGDYRIVREVGRGGMGIVYEAEQLSLGRRVALKLLPPTFQQNERRLKRFQREAETAAKLHHNHIVQVFGVGQQDDCHYFVMQLIKGVSLDRLIARLSRLALGNDATQVGDEEILSMTLDDEESDCLSSLFSRPMETLAETQSVDVVFPQQNRSPRIPTANILSNKHTTSRSAIAQPETGSASDDVSADVSADVRPEVTTEWKPTFDRNYWKQLARLAHQVAGAVSYAHSHNVLHRDIKPANLLIDEAGEVWVTDFGLAKLENAETISQSNDVVGTLRYMAPEQFQGDVDARSDVYALGITLYEMVTLQPAYQESNKQRLIHQILNTNPARPRSINRQIPQDLDTIIMKAVARSPADRYPSAKAMAIDLRRFLENRPITARAISPAERAWRWAKVNPAVASLTAAVLLMLVAVSISSSFAYVRAQQALDAERFKRERLEASSDFGKNLELIYEKIAEPDIGPENALPVGLPDDPQELVTSVVKGLEAHYDHQAELTNNYQQLLALLHDFQSAENPEQLRTSKQAIQEKLTTIRGLIRNRDDLSRPREVLRKLAFLRSNSVPMTEEMRYELAEVYYRLARDEFSIDLLDSVATPDRNDETVPFDDPAGVVNSSMGFGHIARPPSQVEVSRSVRKNNSDQRQARIDVRRMFLARAMFALRSLMHSHPDNAQYQILMSQCLLEMYKTDESSTVPRTGMNAYDQAIELLESLAASDQSTPEIQRMLCNAYLLIVPPLTDAIDTTTTTSSGKSSSDDKRDRYDTAVIEERYYRAIAMTGQLIAGSPHDVSLFELRSKIFFQFGLLEMARKKMAEAKDAFKTSLRILEGLARQYPDEFDYQSRYVRQCIRVAQILKNEKPTVRNGFLFQAARVVELLRQKDSDEAAVNRLSSLIQSEWSHPQEQLQPEDSTAIPGKPPSSEPLSSKSTPATLD